MSGHHLHGVLLFRQDKFELAEQAFRQALAEHPDDADLHAWLAMTLTAREDLKGATEEAQKAVGLAPDRGFVHFALARVLLERDRYAEALVAIGEALRLEPEREEFWGLKAGIHVASRDWTKALEAADRGLSTDPEDETCLNLRAMALTQLGRRAEAAETIRGALEKNPEDSFTHANQGWAYLHQGRNREALEHFREAMRLDPTNGFARIGIVEALKARWWPYAVLLRFFLWMGRLGGKAQWGFIIGIWLFMRVLRGLEKEHPALGPWIGPLTTLYFGFFLATWVAEPLFNLVLRLDRLGRNALSEDQVRCSNYVGVFVAAALVSLAMGWWLDAAVYRLAAWYFGLMLVPIAAAFGCDPGWPRKAMGGYAVTLGLAGFAALAALTPPFVLFAGKGIAAFVFIAGAALFLLGAFLASWVGLVLIRVTPKK